MWNLFKTNNKDNRTTSDVVLASQLLTLNKFTYSSVVSIVSFEQVNGGGDFYEKWNLVLMYASAHSGYEQYVERGSLSLVFLKIAVPKILRNSRGDLLLSVLSVKRYWKTESVLDNFQQIFWKFQYSFEKRLWTADSLSSILTSLLVELYDFFVVSL